MATIVAASFLLTPATALRYEKHDQKNRSLNQAEAMQLGLRSDVESHGVNYNPRRRKVTKGGTSERDEYYVSIRLGNVG